MKKIQCVLSIVLFKRIVQSRALVFFKNSYAVSCFNKEKYQNNGPLNAVNK